MNDSGLYWVKAYKYLNTQYSSNFVNRHKISRLNQAKTTL